jgi:hypothetical protein
MSQKGDERSAKTLFLKNPKEEILLAFLAENARAALTAVGRSSTGSEMDLS